MLSPLARLSGPNRNEDSRSGTISKAAPRWQTHVSLLDLSLLHGDTDALRKQHDEDPVLSAAETGNHFGVRKGKRFHSLGNLEIRWSIFYLQFNDWPR